MNPFEELFSIAFKPTEYFKKKIKEKGIVNSFLFYTLLTIAASAVSTIISNTIRSGVLGFFISLFTIVLMAILLPLSAFISAGIHHLFVMLVGGKQGFANTFKATAYAGTVSVLYELPLLIVTIFILSGATGTIVGSYGMIAILLASYGMYAIILLTMLVHYAIAYTIGVSILQKISKGRAFVTFLIPLAIAFLLALVFAALFLVALTNRSTFLAPTFPS